MIQTVQTLKSLVLSNSHTLQYFVFVSLEDLSVLLYQANDLRYQPLFF